MFHFIGIIIILLLLVVLIPVLTFALWLVNKFFNVKDYLLRKVFGKGYSSSNGYNGGRQGSYTGSSSYSNSSQSHSSRTGGTAYSSSSHGKIIPDGEGEYVDFEEVK